MTKEQEEAIEDLNELKEMYEYLSNYREETDSHYKIFKRRAFSIETVLSMLEEKDKEIETLTQQRDYYKERYNEFNKAFIKMKN